MEREEKRELIPQLERDAHHKKIRELYEGVAPIYDTEWESRVKYSIPGYVKDIYLRRGIDAGSILDIGCGTGRLREYLGDRFTYTGIDLSESMVALATKRGYSAISGATEKVLPELKYKSVDHITALSSVYFIKDFLELIKQLKRIAHTSIVLSVEHFSPQMIKEINAKRGFEIFNHSAEAVKDPTEVIRNVFLWKRPESEERIFGDIVFKNLRPQDNLWVNFGSGRRQGMIQSGF